MSFLGSLFGGSGNQTQTTSSNSTTNVNYAPWYTDYAQDILKRGQELSKTPYQPYDVSKMFAPFQPAQQQAFNQVYANQNAFQPYIGAGAGALNRVSGYDPYQAGMPFIQAAAQSPTGYQAGSPYMRNAAQTWNPQTQAQYTNPFLQGSVNYANDLARQNFLEKTLPGVNAQFVRSGGGLGGSNYTRFMNRALRDFETTQAGAAQTAAANNYWQGAGQFNQDLNRQLQVGQGLGGLATGTQGALGQLGQTASGITSGAVNTGAGIANAYSQLGGQLSNLNLANTNALLQIGNQQQQQAQNPLTAAYQQYQQGVQFPYNQLSWLSNLSSGLRIPSTQTQQSYGTQTQSGGSSPSILGGILGAGSMIAGIPGVGSALGGMASSLGNGISNLFSGFQWNGMPGSSMMGDLTNQANQQLATGNGRVWQRGGHIRGYASGGNVLSATGDLGGVPGGALGNVRQREEEETKPKEPSASEAWSNSGMDANTTAPGYADGGMVNAMTVDPSATSPSSAPPGGWFANTFGRGGLGDVLRGGTSANTDYGRPWTPTASAPSLGMRPPDGMQVSPEHVLLGTGTSGSEFPGSRFGLMGGYGGGLGALSGGMSLGAGPFAGGMQPIAQFPQMGGYGMPQMGGYGMPQMGGYGMPQMGGYGMFRSPRMRGYGMPQMGGMQPMPQMPVSQATPRDALGRRGYGTMFTGGAASPTDMTQSGALGTLGGMPAEIPQINGGAGWAYKRGGAIRRYSQGGTVPVVKAMNMRSKPALAMAAQNARPPVPMPRPSSGALARAAAPMAGGALSAVR